MEFIVGVIKIFVEKIYFVFCQNGVFIIYKFFVYL